MTGPEHYKEAEKCLADSRSIYTDTSEALAEAQVHATLALAAATAMSGEDMHDTDFAEWDTVCGVPARSLKKASDG